MLSKPKNKPTPILNVLKTTKTKNTSIDLDDQIIKNLNAHNKEIKGLYSPISFHIQDNINDINKRIQKYDILIPSFSEDDKCKSINENKYGDAVEEFCLEDRLENAGSWSDELSIEKDQRYFIPNDTPKISVDNKYILFKVNKNEEQFDKDFINEKRERTQQKDPEKTKKKRTLRDYLIKSFLSNFINVYLFKKINELLEKCKLGKICKCDYDMIIKPNESHLAILLEKTVEELFIIYKEKASKKCEKQKNKKLFEFIDNKVNLSKNEEELVNLLKSKFEYQLKLYYKSKEIETFKTKKLKHGTPVDYDKQFYSERNRQYYLLEPYGFIRYAKSEPYCHNK